MAAFAAAIAQPSGKPVAYKDLPEADYKAALLGAGLPDFLAELVAQASACAADGALDDGSGTMRRLIGRPTTPLRGALAGAMNG